MGQGAKKRRSEIKEKEAWCKERKKACGKRSFRYTSRYIPGYIDFDRLCPSSSVIDVAEKCDMAGVKEEEEELGGGEEEHGRKGKQRT